MVVGKYFRQTSERSERDLQETYFPTTIYWNEIRKAAAEPCFFVRLFLPNGTQSLCFLKKNVQQKHQIHQKQLQMWMMKQHIITTPMNNQLNMYHIIYKVHFQPIYGQTLLRCMTLPSEGGMSCVYHFPKMEHHQMDIIIIQHQQNKLPIKYTTIK